MPTPLRAPHPCVPKGKRCACSGRFSLPPSLPSTLLPPSVPGKAGTPHPLGTELSLGELQPLGMQCRETHAFLLSFPKNIKLHLLLSPPFLVPLENGVWFLAEVGMGFLRQVAGQVVESRLPPWGSLGSSGWHGLAHPAAVRFSCEASYALLLEPFLALSSVSLCYLPGVGSWGCHLGADVLHLLCLSHSAHGT